jgi:uncharacterized pyridoxamine 5'-phosphate oxidase family protein
MELEKLDFATVSAEILKTLEDGTKMTLSTCSGNHVTTRMVSTACSGTKILFATFRDSTKVMQIRDNPNVAVGYNNLQIYLQIEGVAQIMGSPQDPKNAALVALYKEKQPFFYNLILTEEMALLVEIEIKRLTRFISGNLNFFVDKIDFENRTAYKDTSMGKLSLDSRGQVSFIKPQN